MQTGQLLLDKAKWLNGWMSLEELSLLAEFASELEDNSIVYEIGSFCGRSSRAIADNSPASSLIYCIDPWDFRIPLFNQNGVMTEMMIIDTTTYHQFCFNLSDHIKTKKVTPIRLTWEDFEPSGKADFIFIDGNHTYEAAKHDIEKAIRYIKVGGIIAGHDYQNFEGVYKAVNERFQKTHIRVKETIWWTKKF